MDTRMSELFGTCSGYNNVNVKANLQGGGTCINNGKGMASKKTSVKNGKKTKSRSARHLKPSNNPPYLPPEVSQTYKSRIDILIATYYVSW